MNNWALPSLLWKNSEKNRGKKLCYSTVLVWQSQIPWEGTQWTPIKVRQLQMWQQLMNCVWKHEFLPFSGLHLKVHTCSQHEHRGGKERARIPLITFHEHNTKRDAKMEKEIRHRKKKCLLWSTEQDVRILKVRWAKATMTRKTRSKHHALKSCLPCCGCQAEVLSPHLLRPCSTGVHSHCIPVTEPEGTGSPDYAASVTESLGDILREKFPLQKEEKLLIKLTKISWFDQTRMPWKRLLLFSLEAWPTGSTSFAPVTWLIYFWWSETDLQFVCNTSWSPDRNSVSTGTGSLTKLWLHGSLSERREPHCRWPKMVKSWHRCGDSPNTLVLFLSPSFHRVLCLTSSGVYHWVKNQWWICFASEEKVFSLDWSQFRNRRFVHGTETSAAW